MIIIFINRIPRCVMKRDFAATKRTTDLGSWCASDVSAGGVGDGILK